MEALERGHIEERTSGNYTGPKGRYFRLVDPKHPTCYLGWSSTKEAAQQFARSADLPDGVVAEAAPQLTPYEARYCDLAKPSEPAPFSAWKAQQEYLTANKVPTIHEAE